MLARGRGFAAHSTIRRFGGAPKVGKPKSRLSKLAVPICRLPITFAVHVDFISFLRGPFHRLPLSVTLKQQFFRSLFLNRMMLVWCVPLRIFDLDDIDFCHEIPP